MNMLLYLCLPSAKTCITDENPYTQSIHFMVRNNNGHYSLFLSECLTNRFCLDIKSMCCCAKKIPFMVSKIRSIQHISPRTWPPIWSLKSWNLHFKFTTDGVPYGLTNCTKAWCPQLTIPTNRDSFIHQISIHYVTSTCKSLTFTEFTLHCLAK